MGVYHSSPIPTEFDFDQSSSLSDNPVACMCTGVGCACEEDPKHQYRGMKIENKIMSSTRSNAMIFSGISEYDNLIDGLKITGPIDVLGGKATVRDPYGRFVPACKHHN